MKLESQKNYVMKFSSSILKAHYFLVIQVIFNNLQNRFPNTAATIVIRMDRMQYIDQSGLYALEDSIIDLKKANKNVLFVDLQKQAKIYVRTCKYDP